MYGEVWSELHPNAVATVPTKISHNYLKPTDISNMLFGVSTHETNIKSRINNTDNK